jgi:hypothetical protein
MKPSDVFVSVIDFFSTLVPGAIATFFLLTPTRTQTLGEWSYLERESAEFWVVFLVVAYFLGHLVSAVGSLVLDHLYDRIYARWRRATSKFARSTLPLKASCLRVLAARLKHVIKKSNPDDELLATAKRIKKNQLGELARAVKLDPDDITNTFWWAGTVVRIKTSAGAAEIDGLSAQSKLFRGIAVLVPFVAVWTGWFGPAAIVGWGVMFALAVWRFMDLRWAATERMYEYFIATSVIPTEGKAGPPAA